MIRTKFTELCGVSLPLMSAPMSRHSGSTLAVAVTEAGGLGLFGAINAGGESWFRQEVTIAKQNLGDKPFGVGFITHLMEDFMHLFDIALEEKVPVVTFSFADPTRYVERAKSEGTTVMCQIQTLAQAKIALDAGADVLVAQGNEAGGHTGPTSLIPILSEVLKHYPDVPVLASGGIGSGTDLAQILEAGADGAWLGTRLLATHECIEVTDSFKRRLISAKAEDTCYTDLFDKANHTVFNGKPWPPGIAARMVRNEMVERWNDNIPALLNDTQALAGYRAELGVQNPDYTPLYAGTSVGSVTEIQSAAEIIREITQEAEAQLG